MLLGSSYLNTDQYFTLYLIHLIICMKFGGSDKAALLIKMSVDFDLEPRIMCIQAFYRILFYIIDCVTD